MTDWLLWTVVIAALLIACVAVLALAYQNFAVARSPRETPAMESTPRERRRWRNDAAWFIAAIALGVLLVILLI